MSSQAGRRLGVALAVATGWLAAGPAAWAGVDEQVQGVWVLEAVQQGERAAHDPRWTMMMTFEGDHLFSAASTQMLEVRRSGPRGAAAKAVQQDVRFLGRYRIVGDRLELRPRPPLAGDALAFATVNFGPAAPNGTFSPRLSLESGLALTNPATGRQLQFQRHKR